MKERKLNPARWLMVFLLAAVFLLVPMGTADDTYAATKGGLTVNAVEFTKGDPIYVKGTTGGSSWIGIYDKNDTPSETVISYYWVNADGNEYNIFDGSCNNRGGYTENRGLYAGEYKIVLFKDGGYSVDQSIDITIKDPTDPENAFAMEKNAYITGEDIWVKATAYGWSDWVGIYEGKYDGYQNKPPSSGTKNWYWTLGRNDVWMNYSDYPAGEYTAALWSNGVCERIINFTVKDSYLSVDDTTISCGQSLMVNPEWHNVDNPSWVGLYKSGENPGLVNASILWRYTSGSSFDLLDKDNLEQYTDRSDEWIDGIGFSYLKPGQYKVVLFNDSTHTVVQEIEITIAHEGTIDVPGKSATCEEAGYTAGKQCVCGTYTEGHETIPALTHKWNGGDVVSSATCKSAGAIKYTCLNDANHTKTETIGIAPDAHGWDEGVVTPPSCTAGGYTTYTCKHCGTTKTGNETEKRKHSMGNWDQTTAPTCSEAGVERRDCLDCDYFETREVAIVADAHKWIAGEVTEPTCAAGGYTTYSCKYCQKTKQDDFTARTGHTMGGWVEIQTPTCSAAGEERSDCEVCDHFDTRVAAIVPDAHEWDNGAQTTAPTCSAKGQMTYTCLHNETHKRYEDIERVDDAHAWNEGDVTKAATCMEEGVMTYTCAHNNQHTYTEVIEIDADAHAWNEGNITKNPTCLDVGEKLFICTYNSAHTKTEDVAVNPDAHKWTEGQILKHPTCMEAGERELVCEHNNGHKSTKAIAKDTNAHTWNNGEITTAPTCSTTGVKTFTCIHNEEHTYTEVVAVDADAHQWNDGKITTAPTCSAEGVKTFACEYDGTHKRTEVVGIDDNAHQWNEGEITTEPTCSTTGVKTFTCIHNDKHTKTEDVAINQNAHSWDNGTETTAPTCTGEGVKTFTCQHNNQHTKTAPIEAVGHKAAVVEGYAATCEGTGIKMHYECSVCHKKFKEEACETPETENSIIIPALTHKWDAGVVTEQPTCAEPGKRTLTCQNDKSHTSVVPEPAAGHKPVFQAEQEATCTEKGVREHYLCSVCTSRFKDEACKNAANEEWLTISALDHNWDAGIVTIAPNCTETGVMTYTCQYDKSHTKTGEIEALGHEAIEQAEQAPTCTENGVNKHYECSVCHVKFQDEACTTEADDAWLEIPFTGHTYGNWYTETEADCGKTGLERRDCIHCDHYQEQEIPAKTHEWDNGVQKTAPTCTTTGVMLYTCQHNANHTYTEDIDALGHDWQENGTCSRCASVSCDEAGHNWQEATCTEAKHCTVCGATDGQKTGHNWDAGEVTTPPTCTENGVRTYTCLHDGTHKKTEDEPALTHDKVHHDAIAATCEGEGRAEYYSCSRCDVLFEADQTTVTTAAKLVVAALQHKWNNGVETTAPTCTTAGVKTFTCQHDSSHTYEEAIDQLGHDKVHHEAEAADCVNDGWNEYYSCSRCDVLFAADETTETTADKVFISKLGHDAQLQEKQPAQCTVDGVEKHYLCTNCKVTFQDAACRNVATEEWLKIEALDHNKVYQEAVDATCGTEGRHEHYNCSRCDVLFEADGKTETTEDALVIDALGHDTVAKNGSAATCTTSGVKAHFACSTCHETFQDEDGTMPADEKWLTIDPLDHDKIYHEEVAAKCESEGCEAYYSCSRCDVLFAEDETTEVTAAELVINPLQHAWNEGEVTANATCTTAGEMRFTCQHDENHSYTTPIGALGHLPIAQEMVKATCETEGVKAHYVCDRCKVKFQDEDCEVEATKQWLTISPLTHAWNAGETTTAATCTTEGVKTYTCQHDNSHTKTETIEALGHDIIAQAGTAATCTEPGAKAHYACSRCQAKFRDENGEIAATTEWLHIDPIPHVWDDGVQTKDPTCSEAGQMTYTCQHNAEHKHYEDVDIAEDAHVWGEGVQTTDPTCSSKGQLTYTCQHNAEHKYYEDVDIDPTAHEYDTVVTAPTCTEQGYTTYTCKYEDCGHSYVADYVDANDHSFGDWYVDTPTKCGVDGVEKRECIAENCGHFETRAIAALQHEYSKVVTAPTCTEQGYTTYTCKYEDCGHSYVADYVDANDHSFGDWYVDTPTKCGVDGVEKRECIAENCGHFETRAIAALQHEYSTVVTAPTCTEQGYTTYTCTREGCGHSYKSDYVDANDHSFGDWTVEVEAKCNATGLEKRVCSVKGCGHVETRTTTALQHEYAEVVTDPTCTAKGYTTYTCKYGCGDSYTGKNVEALGHDMVNGKAVAPTCTETGLTAGSSCTRCDHKVAQTVVAATGHNPGAKATCTTPQLCITCKGVVTEAIGHKEEIIPAKAPTCGETGLTEGKKCSLCQEVLTDQEFISKLGHKEDFVQTKKATTKENGSIVKTCACGTIVSEQVIYSVKTMKLSITKAAFDGKRKTPSLTIRDSQGNKLKKGRDYTVKYPKYRKLVGKYAYKITFKGNYAGNETVYMTIQPQKTSIKKVTAAKKAVTVKWNKVRKQTSGYQIMVATNKKFTKNKKTVTVKNYKTTSKKVTKLKSKKKYYVRVRTYRIAKGVKIYGSWSKVKTVRVK